jgi:hypothetical protein
MKTNRVDNLQWAGPVGLLFFLIWGGMAVFFWRERLVSDTAWYLNQIIQNK